MFSSIGYIFVFLAGAFAGLAVNIAFGPVSLYYVRRNLSYGFIAAFVSGLGAVTADVVYAAAAALGTSSIASLIRDNIIEVKIAGGLLFVAYGLSVLSKSEVSGEVDAPRSTANVVGGYFTGFFMTIANPGGFVWFGALYAGTAGLMERLTGEVFSTGHTYPLLLGSALGLTSWWLILSTFAFRLRYHLKNGGFRGISRVLGLIIILIGCYFFAEGLGHLLPEGWYKDLGLVYEAVVDEIERFITDNF